MTRRPSLLERVNDDKVGVEVDLLIYLFIKALPVRNFMIELLTFGGELFTFMKSNMAQTTTNFSCSF